MSDYKVLTCDGCGAMLAWYAGDIITDFLGYVITDVQRKDTSHCNNSMAFFCIKCKDDSQ